MAEISLKRVDDLQFDPVNPRLPSSKTGASERDVLEYMVIEAKVTDLMLSIATQGYFNGEPILVVPSESDNGKFIVVEGNRRLAALKLLINPEKAPLKHDTINEISQTAIHKPDEIPVIVYSKREDVLEYLGYRHITGVDQWDSLAKARYLYQLKSTRSEKDYKLLLKELAKIIGSRGDYVHKLLSGYELYKEIEANDFYKISGLNEESFSFSLLTTATSYTEIGAFVGASNDKSTEKINKPHLEELTKWVFKEDEGKTRLGESRNLKTLNAVISSPKALQAFRDGRPLEEARLLTDEPKEIFSNSIDTALKRLKDAKDQSHLINKPNQLDADNLREIFQMARELYTSVNSKLLSDLETID